MSNKFEILELMGPNEKTITGCQLHLSTYSILLAVIIIFLNLEFKIG